MKSSWTSSNKNHQQPITKSSWTNHPKNQSPARINMEPEKYPALEIWKNIDQSTETTSFRLQNMLVFRACMAWCQGCHQNEPTYGWWKNSQTTTWDVENPVNNGVNGKLPINWCRISSINTMTLQSLRGCSVTIPPFFFGTLTNLAPKEYIGLVHITQIQDA